MRAEIGLRCLRHLRWYGWCTTELRSCEGSETTFPHVLASLVGRMTSSSCALALQRSPFALRAQAHFVANLRFAPFTAALQECFLRKQGKACAYMRGMTMPLTFYRHSAFFSANEGVPCVFTMGSHFRFPIFDTLVSKKIW